MSENKGMVKRLVLKARFTAFATWFHQVVFVLSALSITLSCVPLAFPNPSSGSRLRAVPVGTEENSPVEDTEDASKTLELSSLLSGLRQQRSRQGLPDPNVLPARQIHLPHRHGGLCGHPLPVSSPFTQGVCCLPLRC